jgi:AcrR family transcriptional regulator
LPRGAGALSPEIVAEIQQARIFEAMCLAIAEEGGFGKVTVTDIVDRTGTSTRSFYEYFDNKEACVLAAFGAYSAQLGSDLAAAWADAERWDKKVSAAISAALEYGAQAPLQLRFLLVDAQSAGSKLVSEQRFALERLAGRLREGRTDYARAVDLSTGTEEMVVAGIVWRIASTEQAVVAGAVGLIGDRLLAERPDRLRACEPQLIELVLAPYLGRGEARQIALS